MSEFYTNLPSLLINNSTMDKSPTWTRKLFIIITVPVLVVFDNRNNRNNNKMAAQFPLPCRLISTNKEYSRNSPPARDFNYDTIIIMIIRAFYSLLPTDATNNKIIKTIGFPYRNITGNC